MALKEIKERPQFGGLKPIRIDGVPYLDGMTQNFIVKCLKLYPKYSVDSLGDCIIVDYEREIVHTATGKVFQEEKDRNLGYKTEDKGRVLSYELHDKTIFAQADIDNDTYNKILHPSTGDIMSINYIDGQVEQENEDGEMVMMDKVVTIEPLHRKGDINLATEKVVSEAYEPLAGWENMLTSSTIGQTIREAVIATILDKHEIIL